MRAFSQEFEKSLKSRKQFEIKFMADIESSLNGALDNLNAEKVSFHGILRFEYSEILFRKN